MLLCLQKEDEDHQGAVLVTALDCGQQWCLCGYWGNLGGGGGHQSAKNGFDVMLTTTRVALVAMRVG